MRVLAREHVLADIATSRGGDQIRPFQRLPSVSDLTGRVHAVGADSWRKSGHDERRMAGQCPEVTETPGNPPSGGPERGRFAGISKYLRQ